MKRRGKTQMAAVQNARRWVVCGMAGLAAWAGASGAAHAAVVTEVGSVVAGVAAAGVVRVPCPEGAIVLGGGLDPANVETMRVTSSAPAFGPENTDRLIFRSNGSQEAGVAWQASAFNQESFNQTIKVAAVCATGIEATTEVVSALVAASSVATQTVLCPTGSVAIGGGVDVSNVGQMSVTATAPVWGPGPPESLATRPDGANPAPSGWSATVRNAGAPQVLAVAAVCIDAATPVVSEVVTLPVPVNGTGQTRTFCPDGMQAASGGVLPTNTSDVYVTASAPAFGPDPFDLLFLQPDGPNPAPVAWQWNVRNDTDGVLSAKAAVVCVPEPGGVASAFAAAATLFGVSARRRSRRAAAARRSRAAFPTPCC